MKLIDFCEFNHAEMITPVGLSFGINPGGADLFVLQVIGDEDSPIRWEGQMVVFKEQHQCQKALERLQPNLAHGVKAEFAYDSICDIAGAIDLLTNCDYDRDAVVLDCVNTLLDLIETGPFDLPNEYTILKSLADHLTFREKFEEFEMLRSKLTDALLWCAGSVAVNLKLITSDAEFESIVDGLSVESKTKPARRSALP